MVTEYYDVFCEDGFRRTVREFYLQIDIGNHPPIYCKPPRYGTHGSEVMQKLVERLDRNCVVEEDDRLWVALVVIAAKPRQENVPWNEYQWRLCVSYQKLN